MNSIPFIRTLSRLRKRNTTQKQNEVLNAEGRSWSALPADMIEKIAEHLSYKDTFSLALVDKTTASIVAERSVIPKAFYRQSFPLKQAINSSNPFAEYARETRPWLIESERYNAVLRLDKTFKDLKDKPKLFRIILFHAIYKILEKAKSYKIVESKRYLKDEFLGELSYFVAVELSPSCKVAAVLYKSFFTLKLLLKQLSDTSNIDKRFVLCDCRATSVVFTDDENLYLALVDNYFYRARYVSIQQFKNYDSYLYQTIDFKDEVYTAKFNSDVTLLGVLTNHGIGTLGCTIFFIFNRNESDKWILNQEIQLGGGGATDIIFSPKNDEVLLTTGNTYRLIKQNKDGKWYQETNFPQLPERNQLIGSVFTPDGRYLSINDNNLIPGSSDFNKNRFRMLTRDFSGKIWQESQRIISEDDNYLQVFSDNSQIMLLYSKFDGFAIYMLNVDGKKWIKKKTKVSKKQEFFAFHPINFHSHKMFALPQICYNRENIMLLEFNIIPK